MSYQHLLAPLEVRGGTLPNRLIMGSMHTGLEDHPWHSDQLAAYYAERARGGVGMIITGGYSPTISGWLTPFGAQLITGLGARVHRRFTEAVHAESGLIALQMLHAGRYGYHPLAVSASSTRSPISRFRARALTPAGVEATIAAFARTARLARAAGYDGVEIMGSEGYLLNQFLAPATNRRTDRWGGSVANRLRFPVEVVRRVRAAVGETMIISYRISLLDLVPDGQTWDEVVALARAVEDAGASLLNTGIGWHEARVPTIITQVPRAAWTDLSGRLRREVSIPVSASNRLNTPDLAEQVLAGGTADLITMARPLLADPEFLIKVREGRTDEINTCIACNQACLDHAFTGRPASCLVNPRAGRETVLLLRPVSRPRTLAVVGAGPAGLACSTAAAQRGLAVTLFEAASQIGGQFLLAARVPGKADYGDTLRFYRRRLDVLGVDVRLGVHATAADLAGFDELVIATGVVPRVPPISGIDHPSVASYADLLSGRVQPGARVAVIGAGGIGVDVATFLVHTPETLSQWKAHWGIADPAEQRGGLTAKARRSPPREVWLLQRKPSAIGRGLGKTSGWAHRAVLRDSGVHQLSGVTYERIDDDGLHISVDGTARSLAVDQVIICAGQESVRDLAGLPGVHIIGGADVAAELDAERAILQGTQVAAGL